MERRTRDGAEAATARPMTPRQFEAFYEAKYRELVKILMLSSEASFSEAEEAVQDAMLDFYRRSKAGQAVSNPAAYVRTAARNFFVKARQRERERPTRELRHACITPEVRPDDALTASSEEEHVEQRLGCLTAAQREVVKLVMDGMTTQEIAEQLGKTLPNIRQLHKQGRDRLMQHPDLAPMAPKAAQGSGPEPRLRSTETTPEPRKEEVQ